MHMHSHMEGCTFVEASSLGEVIFESSMHSCHQCQQLKGKILVPAKRLFSKAFSYCPMGSRMVGDANMRTSMHAFTH